MIFGESDIWSILNSTLYETPETKILQLYAKSKWAKFHMNIGMYKQNNGKSGLV